MKDSIAIGNELSRASDSIHFGESRQWLKPCTSARFFVSPVSYYVVQDRQVLNWSPSGSVTTLPVIATFAAFGDVIDHVRSGDAVHLASVGHKCPDCVPL